MPRPFGSKGGGKKGCSGKKTEYKPEYAEQARKLCLLRATDAELGDFFDVSRQTIDSWKNKFPEFAKAIKLGKDIADATVADSLYQRAAGYSHNAVKIFMPPGAVEPVYAPYTEHYPPDTNAASLWLRNRQPAKWRDRQEVTGADGGPLQITVVNYALPGKD